ncbi:phospholipase [Streptomyces sp. B1866]|uniref:phospholipase n=1 Tax=Streptomyces sp. B1866 TaxID=3075431 RepID=UPI0028925007|nr:phospholipase [Streptomyces sp. B1866]MDT3398839.1 phospholipase [Streptomyces sp. B1866]
MGTLAARAARVATGAVTTAAAVVLAAAPAEAVPADKPEVLSSWTQTSVTSYDAWLSARNDLGAWAAYAFDWTTDYCSSSPDNPFGFPFKLSCARHDFGYRNYKRMGTFAANKSRLDSAFYEDLKRVCAQYGGAAKTSCDGTAWTYYQAVKAFG